MEEEEKRWRQGRRRTKKRWDDSRGGMAGHCVGPGVKPVSVGETQVPGLVGPVDGRGLTLEEDWYFIFW